MYDRLAGHDVWLDDVVVADHDVAAVVLCDLDRLTAQHGGLVADALWEVVSGHGGVEEVEG